MVAVAQLSKIQGRDAGMLMRSDADFRLRDVENYGLEVVQMSVDANIQIREEISKCT